MWQQANGRAISSSGLREGTLARDCARRVVARSIREGGRVVVVGTMRLRVRWIEAEVDAMLGFVVSWWNCGFAGLVVEVKCWGDAFGGKVFRELYARTRDFWNGLSKRCVQKNTVVSQARF
jgi:hypothetical protein